MTSYYSCHILLFTQTNLRAMQGRTIPVCESQQVGILGVHLRLAAVAAMDMVL